MKIPTQLQDKDFRFVLLKKNSKIPIENEWQKQSHDFEDAQKHKGNLGIIFGHKNLFAIDIDSKEFLAEIMEKGILPLTFTVKTALKQLPHYYFISNEPLENCILFFNGQRVGELRAKNQQCVIPSSEIDSKQYEVWNDAEICLVNKKEFLKILEPYIKKNAKNTSINPQIKDESRSGLEYRKVIALLREGKTKEQIFSQMLAYSGWKEKGIAYQEFTYKKAFDYVKSEDKLKAFLIEDRKKFESIGCGVHNGIYYEGTIFYKDGTPYPAIITSDKKVYIKQFDNDEIRYSFGLNYKGNFYEESLDNIFSKEAVKRWIYENTDNITFKSVYDKLITLFKKYIYFEDERKYSLLACYRIAGFFMPIWRARARLFLYAEPGSAKSRGTQILHNTGFNSIALGDWTLAYLKEIIQSTRGETHIDDFETLDEEKKSATTRLVKVGFMKGFKAGKMGEGKNRKPEVNDLFNTTTLNNTEGLDFISTDRCITIRIPKISKKEYDEEPKFEDSIWKELRDELYIFGLKYPDIVKETYDNLKSENIRGRLFFIIKPELAIAKLISEDVFTDVESIWQEEIEQRLNTDFETDWEFLAYKRIYKLLSTLSTNSTLSILSTLSTTGFFALLNDVVKPIGLELYGDEGFAKAKRSMSIVIGNSLSRNPIFKKRQVRGKWQYKVNFEQFKSLLDAKGLLKPILELLEVDSVDSVDSDSGKMAITTEKIK